MIKLEELEEKQQVLMACYLNGAQLSINFIFNYFLAWYFENTSRNAVFEGQKEVLWSLNPDTSWP